MVPKREIAFVSICPWCQATVFGYIKNIPNVNLVPLDEINQNLNRFDHDKAFYLHCAGGYRSMIALSILKNRGVHTGINVLGGMKSIKESDISLQQPSCTTTS